MSVAFLGAVVALFSIYLSFYIQFSGSIPYRSFNALENSFIWIAIGFIIITFLFGTYVFYNKSLLDIFYLTMLTALMLNIYIMALTFLFDWQWFPRSVLFLNFLFGTILLYIFNSLVYIIYHRVRGQKKILIIGENHRVLQAVRNFSQTKNNRHRVTHVVLSNYLENIQEYVNEVDIVYLAGIVDESQRLEIFEYLMRNNKKLFLSTEFENLMMVNPNIMNFEDESIIEVSGFKIPSEEGALKRSFDIIVALFLIVVTLPIMLITAILIKVDSKGPILYKQERVTLNEKRFNILKFRSMTVSAEANSGPVLAKRNDSRITNVGRIIRSTRIDELPQLFNVLKGDMSLVGPRPERPFFVEQFKDQNRYYSLRHHVRAGITGFAQVYGKYDTDFNNKLNFDLLYIKNYSLAFDFKLLFQTIKILFDKVSSRGFEEETVLSSDEWQDYEDEIKIIR